jgi:membrane-bound inhibitor of C-type lysozyme
MTSPSSNMQRAVVLSLVCALAACSSTKTAAPTPAPTKAVIVDASAPVRAPAPAATAPVAASAPAPAAAPLAPAVPRTATPAPVSRPAVAAASYRMPEGVYRCDEGKRVTVKQSSADGHTVTINANGADTVVKFLPGSSGALRYENAASQLTWILTADKGMLFDNKKGQRLANNCKI